MAESDVTRKLMFECIEMLERHFREQPDVYVSGNILIYYREGDPTRSVSPDVLVARGVEKRDRRIYQTWVEGKMPEVVLEIVSETTWRRDLGIKASLYCELGVEEYFLFDSTGVKFDEGPLVGMVRDVAGFRETEPDERGRFRSEVLGLELVAEEGRLRFYDAQTGRRLPTAEERVAKAEARVRELEQELLRLRSTQA